MKKISIIIVHYYIESILFECLTTIDKKRAEIIVVDNGSKTGFKQRLLEKHANVVYIHSGKNLGYGAGNNLGAHKATSDYLFFLNPDTQLHKNALTNILDFAQKNPHVGIIAPTLLHENGAYFSQQGSQLLTPLTALCAHSVFHTIWKSNPIAQRFWLAKIDQKKNRKVAVVPGTAFVINKKLFEKIGRFDPHFFLYFEEYDLCKRVAARNKEIWMLGNALVTHQWGATTQLQPTKKIYARSFEYYLVKHYGFLGEITFWLTQISGKHLLALLILLLLFLIIVIK